MSGFQKVWNEMGANLKALFTLASRQLGPTRAFFSDVFLPYMLGGTVRWQHCRRWMPISYPCRLSAPIAPGVTRKLQKRFERARKQPGGAVKQQLTTPH